MDPNRNNADENLALTSPAYASSWCRSKFAHPIKAVNGNPNTMWAAGATAGNGKAFTFRVDLWGSCEVASVEAVVAQCRPGHTHHQLFFKNPKTETVAQCKWNGETDNDLTLQYSGDRLDGIRWVEIKTIESQGWAAWREIRVIGKRKQRNTELNNFGYIFGHWGDEDYLPEQSTRANVFMCDGGTKVLADRVKSAKQANMKSLVSLKELFGVHACGAVCSTCWESTKRFLKPLESSIIAFVQCDEPYHPFHKKKLTKDQLEKIALIVKADFPNTPIAAFFAPSSVVHKDFKLPEHHDWFSFTRHLESNESERFHTVLSTYYSVLKNKMSAGQRFFIVGDGCMVGSDKAKEYNRIVRAREYYAWAASTKGVVMYLPYMWPDASGMTGSRSLSRLKSDFDRISERIRK
jgi:hypothetical protein